MYNFKNKGRTVYLERRMLKISYNTFIKTIRNCSQTKRDCKVEVAIRRALCKREVEVSSFNKCKPAKDIIIIPGDVAIRPISGVPDDAFDSNTVVIKKPSKNCMQSGTANTHTWMISYYTDSPNWENPLMGWTSGSNSQKDVEIMFPDKESAIKFAKLQGWCYVVSTDQEKEKSKMRKKSYSLNFSWNKRARISTK